MSALFTLTLPDAEVSCAISARKGVKIVCAEVFFIVRLNEVMPAACAVCALAITAISVPKSTDADRNDLTAHDLLACPIIGSGDL